MKGFMGICRICKWGTNFTCWAKTRKIMIKRRDRLIETFCDSGQTAERE